MRDKEYIGTGWKFPPAFSKASYTAEMISGADDIKESLRILFSTMQGERIMLPDYGSGLRAMLYENLNNTIINLMKFRIDQAILFFEPRIDVESIDIRQENPENEGLVLVDVTYIISASNERANMVYPFYLNEGTSVPSQYLS
jgi:phage baseplate assembly protein W